MDISVKVIIEEKEYQRLLDVETKYKELISSKSSNQMGDGKLCHCHESTSVPLTQIIAENQDAHALKSPVAGILPSITTSEESHEEKQSSTSLKSGASPERMEEALEDNVGYHEFVLPWYYIGTPSGK